MQVAAFESIARQNIEYCLLLPAMIDTHTPYNKGPEYCGHWSRFGSDPNVARTALKNRPRGIPVEIRSVHTVSCCYWNKLNCRESSAVRTHRETNCEMEHDYHVVARSTMYPRSTTINWKKTLSYFLSFLFTNFSWRL